MRYSLLLVATIVCLSSACDDSKPSTPSSVTAITVSGTTPAVGAVAQFTATAALPDGSSRPVTSEATWQSSNTAVATVDRGIVRAVAAGEADISATFENSTGRLRITVGVAPCSYFVSPTSVSIPTPGGTATVNVTTGATCTWTAVSSASFVTITNGASRTGSGTTSITVAANDGDPRSGVLTIAGRQVTVSQNAGNCVTSLSPSTVDYSAELKRGTISVTAPAGCQWTTVSPTPFISVNSIATGNGNGSISYRVFGNLTSATRSGSIQVGQHTVSVIQRAPLGGNFVSFVSDTGDYIGQGWTLLHEAPTSTFTPTNADAARNRASLRIVGSDGLSTLSWGLDFAAPQGQQLVPGTYLNATRYPFQAPTVPGLSFSGDGRGCNMLSGQFTITEAVFGGDGLIQRLRATFEQHCEGGGPALRGTVAFAR